MGACASHGPNSSLQQVHVTTTEQNEIIAAMNNLNNHNQKTNDNDTTTKRSSTSLKSKNTNRASVSLTSISSNGGGSGTLNLTSLNIESHENCEDLLSPSRQLEIDSRRSTGGNMTPTSGNTQFIQVHTLQRSATPKSVSNRTLTKTVNDISNANNNNISNESRVESPIKSSRSIILSSSREAKTKSDSNVRLSTQLSLASKNLKLLHQGDEKRLSQENSLLTSEEKRISLQSQQQQLFHTNNNITVNSVSITPSSSISAPSFPPPSSATFKQEELNSINQIKFSSSKIISNNNFGDVPPVLPSPQPLITSERISSETSILDIIRSIGQSSDVSVNIISGFTRCSPSPVLSGPSSRASMLQSQWTSPICCAKLHCNRCNMDVMMLDHHQWSDQCTKTIIY